MKVDHAQRESHGCVFCMFTEVYDWQHPLHIHWIYIYTCYPPHKSTFFTVFFLLPQYPPWSIFLAEYMLSYLFIRDAEINIGKMGRNIFLTAFDLKKKTVTWKCCLQVTIYLEDKIFPQKRNTILAKDAIHALISSAFLSFLLYDHGF